jgi:geranylgeranyl diphosphate synthase type I
MTQAESPFNRFSRDYLPLVDDELSSIFDERIKDADPDFEGKIYRELKEYCLRPGKRIRPLLLLLACRGYGREPGTMKGPAAALELMHDMLLVQDDIMDRAEIRRGGPALHVSAGDTWRGLTRSGTIGRDVAIVYADILFSMALELAGKAEVSRRVFGDFLAIFSRTYERTALGQILDTLYSRSHEPEIVDQDIPGRIIRDKTAYYTIYYPLLMGYVLAGGDSDREKKMIEECALPLGVAFQLRDDILGIFGGSGETGKADDSDLREEKMTFIVSRTLDKLGEPDRERFVRLFTGEEKTGEQIEELRHLIKGSGALDLARKEWHDHLGKAREGIARLGCGEEEKGVLLDLCRLLEKA